MPAYKPMLPAPSAAVKLLVFQASNDTPPTPMRAANAAACLGPTRPEGSGRIIVRFIIRSFLISINWLQVFAQAEHIIVPTEVHTRPAHSIVSPLPTTYPADAVETTNALSLNFESSLYTFVQYPNFLFREKSSYATRPAEAVSAAIAVELHRLAIDHPPATSPEALPYRVAVVPTLAYKRPGKPPCALCAELSKIVDHARWANNPPWPSTLLEAMAAPRESEQMRRAQLTCVRNATGKETTHRCSLHHVGCGG
mmetsp:Transcript_32466/g.70927  ORF Transcript_32466/g.70927 Transcript_32466/m.70927 type:complete len:254 (-) Transcript_32466:55-816(-)